jgi:hypothetical protein
VAGVTTVSGFHVGTAHLTGVDSQISELGIQKVEKLAAIAGKWRFSQDTAKYEAPDEPNNT